MSRRTLPLGLAVLCLLVAAALTLAHPEAQAASLFDDRHPVTASQPDAQPVELGVRFSSSVPGTIGAIRFYKSAENTGVHTGALWSADGTRLASVTFTHETSSGWQTGRLAEPVDVVAGQEYVASYRAPSGHYSGDPHAFDAGYTRGPLSVPAGGGVYRYGPTGLPTQVHENINYYVDVDFSPSVVGSASATGTTSAETPGSPGPDVLSLPRVPWEGGPSYYASFPRSRAFDDPEVFPIGIWWGDFESDANVKWDKDHGINFYVQLNGSEDASLLRRNDMYWVGSAALPGMAKDDPSWVGYWLSDETDGRSDPPSAGQAQVQKEIDAQRGTSCPDRTSCRFAYANYTTIVTSDYNAEQIAQDEKYVNMVKGPVSVDGYYYTDPHCSVPPAQYRDAAHDAPDLEHCRSAAAYGNLLRTLRLRDASDGDLKPLWGFVENGAPNDANGVSIAPEQMKAAMMSMIINEARGVVWFNQSFSGSCLSGNVIRDAEARPTGCNAARVEAMKEVDLQVQSLAPVLNTQSYRWDFRAAGAETMLKVKDGSAYVFADVGLDQSPGVKTFTLPAGVHGRTVEVVGENRTLPVSAGTFTDTFARESSYHIYRISL